ncbi:hypothetical protein [Beijerinckia sp. L45]|nr:hypothetical protein [Beijerinckia sp. L45]
MMTRRPSSERFVAASLVTSVSSRAWVSAIFCSSSPTWRVASINAAVSLA